MHGEQGKWELIIMINKAIAEITSDENDHQMGNGKQMKTYLPGTSTAILTTRNRTTRLFYLTVLFRSFVPIVTLPAKNIAWTTLQRFSKP